MRLRYSLLYQVWCYPATRAHEDAFSRDMRRHPAPLPPAPVQGGRVPPAVNF
jgi:hypothetical protein